MDLLTIGALMEDPELRTRVHAACLVQDVELTTTILTTVIRAAAGGDLSDGRILQIVSSHTPGPQPPAYAREQKAQIADSETTVSDQQAQIDALTNRLDALESKVY